MSDDIEPRAPLKIVPISSKSNNSATWSPEQCIATFLDEIRTETILPKKILILWFDEPPEGGLRPHRWFANVTSAEEIAMLELGKHIAIDTWRGRR